MLSAKHVSTIHVRLAVSGALEACSRLAAIRWLLAVAAVSCVACGGDDSSSAVPGSSAHGASAVPVIMAQAGTLAPATTLGAAGRAAPGAPVAVASPARPSGAAGSPAAGDGPAMVAPPEAPQAVVGFCEVEPILREHCQLCHAAEPKFGAPMPLLTLADLQAPSKTNPQKKVVQLISERIHDAQRPMPPAGSTMLSGAASATLDAFVAGGAMQGSAATCASGGALQPVAAGAAAPLPATGGERGLTADDAPWPEDCGEHYKFLASGAAAGGKFQVAAGRQFYQQFSIPAPWGTEATQVLRFKPIVDNQKILHHFILYGPDGSFIDGWAPGQQGITMPPTVGMNMPAGNYRLEIHYNNETGTSAELDASGTEFCVPKVPRPNLAGVHELGSLLINVPAHGMQVLPSTCKPNITKGPVHIIEMHPHMHRTGVHAKLVLTRASGAEEVLHDAAFSFDDQRKYIMPEDGSAPDVMLSAGDSLTATCTYNNTTNTPLFFGTNTENEMCFFYVIAWPLGQLSNGSRGPEGEPNACM